MVRVAHGGEFLVVASPQGAKSPPLRSPSLRGSPWKATHRLFRLFSFLLLAQPHPKPVTPSHDGVHLTIVHVAKMGPGIGSFYVRSIFESPLFASLRVAGVT